MGNLPCLTGVLAVGGGLEVRWAGLHAGCRDEARRRLELLTGAEAPWSQPEDELFGFCRF